MSWHESPCVACVALPLCQTISQNRDFKKPDRIALTSQNIKILGNTLVTAIDTDTFQLQILFIDTLLDA